uniref:breast cancer anti-estrogen resistance protein 1 isoform X2 n=1 Tax=Doryrhamphus excisus TaxID=161450 RepID=UPI0025ADD6C4|nr:breast cancer anti-estrogen resistance protein 1 isoform X2 [Doryrhamphus excisus]
MKYLNVLAKALYDNVAETPDELSFRKGDILTVLEHNTQGLDGWWLCSLHGRQGIVPGNRLKILVGMHDGKEPGMADPASSSPTSQLQRLLHPKPSLAQHAPMPSIYSTPSPAKPKHDPVYMIPPKHGPKPDTHILYQASSDPRLPLKVKLEPSVKAVGAGVGNDVYQVPPSLDKRTWEDRTPLDKMLLSSRACDTVNSYQDKYDFPPRHQLPSRQDIYDVPPTRDQYNTQVYDFPPTVSKDVPDAQVMKEETYDVPSHLSRTQTQAFAPEFGRNTDSRPNDDIQDNPALEDVYDVPPPLLSSRHLHGDGGKVNQSADDIYDIPPSLRTGGHPAHGVYDIPREHEEEGIHTDHAYIYDVPPQVLRDGQATGEELHGAFKRLSASSTGSTLSNHSASSGDGHRDAAPSPRCFFAAKPLLLDLDTAMERLSRLQQAVDLSVSMMMSIITGNWRSPGKLDGNLPALHQAANGVCATLRDFLEFSHGAVANAGQATDRSLQTKLAHQVGKLEEVFQSVITQTQSLDAELTRPQPGGDVLDQLVITARGIPEDTKQLTSFLHGNASLLFKHSHQPQLPPLPGHVTGSGSHPMGEKANIQSRPLPPPPKFAAAEEDGVGDDSYETTEGWMEDYDYVHLQMKHSERQEVGQPINQDLTGRGHLPQNDSSSSSSSSSRLCHADRQLLLFYLQQSEQNFTSVNDAIVAFSSAVNANQLPKTFVAHSKFVIVGAHKLLFIGDTLSRQARSPQVRAQIGQTSSTLCHKLKDFVMSTKTASLHYPSPGAAREMSERLMELAGSTRQFQMVLGQLLMV